VSPSTPPVCHGFADLNNLPAPLACTYSFLGVPRAYSIQTRTEVEATSSQVFSVFGKPDVTLSPPNAEGYTVEVRGVDVYDPNTGDFEASSADQVAAWFVDTDYDGATFLVRQAYFPSQSPNPWEKISKALKGSVDADQFAALQRTTSLPFKAGKHRQCAVKVIDNRGNEVMTVLRLQ
jgi:adenine-specific DNA-methyltransferase